MTTERETARIVRAWLTEGATVLPERVLDDVLEQIPSIRQTGRSRWPGARTPWRARPVVAASLAAILSAGFVLVGALGPDTGRLPGAGRSQPASDSPYIRPTVPPRPEPTASPLPPPVAGPMEGTYRFADVDGTSIGVTFTVPAGWAACCGGGWVDKYATNPPNGLAFSAFATRNVYADPCDRSAGATAIGPGVADLIAAVEAQPERRPTVPTPVTVSGFSGQEIEWSVPSNANFGDCMQSTYVSFYGGDDPTATRFHQGPDQVDHLRVLDVDGTTLTILTTWFPGTTSLDRTQLDDIVASIVIEPGPGPSGPSPSPSAPPSPESSPSPAG
jgi:hypothetical protein